MSVQIQWRKGTTAQHAGFTGAQAEVTVDTDKNTVVVHDGVTAGGIPLAKFSELGVGKTSDTGSAILPKGTTAERDAVPLSGYARFNTTTGFWEGYNGAIWTSLGDITLATNLAGGSNGTIPYQTSANNTAMLAVGTAGQVLESAGAAAPVYAYRRQQEDIDYTLAANALTLKLNPTTLEFRSTTLTVGTPVKVSNAAQVTTTISSGSTGGTTGGVQSNILLLAINNAGTIELAWINYTGATTLDETGLISTTAEGGIGGADSATTIYSTTARANVAYRIVGIFRSTQTVAGTWAQAPTLVQGIGGRVFPPVSSVNGVVGAVVTASNGAIGSCVIGRPANGDNYAVGSTRTDIQEMSFDVWWNYNGGAAIWSWQTTGIAFVGAAPTPTLMTGSWICTSRAYGEPLVGGIPGLWMRYA